MKNHIHRDHSDWALDALGRHGKNCGETSNDADPIATFRLLNHTNLDALFLEAVIGVISEGTREGSSATLF